MPMGQTNVGVIAFTLTPRGGETINLADGLVHTLTTPATGVAPWVYVLEADGGAFRYTDNGTAPTTTTGLRVADGGVYENQLSALTNVKLIRDGTDAGKVNVLYYTYATVGEA